jgi:hypothetical protein
MVLGGCYAHDTVQDGGMDAAAPRDAAADAGWPDGQVPCIFTDGTCRSRCCSDGDGGGYCCGADGMYPDRGWGCGSEPPCPANQRCVGDVGAEACGQRCFAIPEEEEAYGACYRLLYEP